MKRRLPLGALAALLLLAGCQDENPLTKTFSFTGVWETSASEGSAFVFELREVGDSLAGNLYVEDAAGERGEPAPLLGGKIRGEKISFTFDFAGAEVYGVPVDTIAFRGTLLAEDVLDMKQWTCWADTCVDVPLYAVRQASGF